MVDGQEASISDKATDDLRSLLDHNVYPWLRQVDVPSTKCLTLLSLAADTNKHIKAEDYLVFSDGMSNGYYTTNDIRTYSDMPNINKVVFMMMACQCADINESTDCCKDGNAHLDVSRLDIETPENMSDETKQYLSDICSTALYAIGNNVLTNTESRTVPPTSVPVVINTSSPSSSGQEATQTTSAPISPPSGQQSEDSTAEQVTSNPTTASSESTSLVSEVNSTESVVNGEDDKVIETTTTSATIGSSIVGSSSSTIAVGLLPEEVEEDDDMVVDDNSDTKESDDGLELEEDIEENNSVEVCLLEQSSGLS